MRQKSLPYIALLGSLYGISLVVSRFSLGQFDPRAFVSLRLMLASAAHLLVYLFAGTRSLPRNPALWSKSSVLGIFGTAIPMVSAVSSLQYVSSGVAALLFTLHPILVVLLAGIFLPDEKLTWRKLVGAMIAFLGAGILLMRGETGLGEFTQADWRGYAWIGLGLISGAAAAIFARRHLRSSDNFDVASIRMFSACLVLIPVVLLTEGYDLSRVTWAGYVALIYGGLIGGFAAFLLSFYILKRFGATANSMSAYISPLVSAVLGVLLLGEHITPLILVSVALILAGVLMLNRELSRGSAAPV